MSDFGRLLSEGRIPLSEAEVQAVDELTASAEAPATLTRRDPGESGPLLVQVGDVTYLVAEDGSTREVTE